MTVRDKLEAWIEARRSSRGLIGSNTVRFAELEALLAAIVDRVEAKFEDPGEDIRESVTANPTRAVAADGVLTPDQRSRIRAALGSYDGDAARRLPPALVADAILCDHLDIARCYCPSCVVSRALLKTLYARDADVSEWRDLALRLRDELRETLKRIEAVTSESPDAEGAK